MNVRSPRLPSYKACSAVLRAGGSESYTSVTRGATSYTIVKSTSNISMDEGLCALRSQIHSNLRDILKMK